MIGQRRGATTLADIFISYSRPDRARIKRLAAALESVGYTVWWDMVLTGGAQFSKETGAELNAAKAVVVCWSKSSIESMWVADEASVGRKKKNLVPIAIDAVEPPLGFGQIHAVDFNNWAGEPGEPCFSALTKALGAVIGREAPTIAPPPLWRRLVARAKARPVQGAAPIAALVLVALAFVGFKMTAEQGDDLSALDPHSVAVMPFTNAGGDRENDYLSEGLADDLRDALSGVEGLHVKARASSVAVAAQKLNVREIARRIGAGRIVEGSVQAGADKLRVTVRIVDAKTGDQTWSQSYERGENGVLAIEQEIAAAVVRELAESAEAPALATDDITAYDKLLLAQHYDHEVRDAQVVDETNLAKAIELYKAAVDADPSSAIAHARLAGALLYAGSADEAEPEIFRALTINPNLAEVQSTLGDFYVARLLPGGAAAYQRAVDLNPNEVNALDQLAHAHWSHEFRPIGDVESLFRRAVEADPMSLRRYSTLGYFYGVTGERGKALAVVRDIANRFSDAAAYSATAQIYEQIGEFDLAVAAMKSALQLAPQNEAARAQLAELYAEIGDFPKAARYEPEAGLGQLFWRRDYKALVDLGEEIAIDQPEDVEIWYLLGFGYAVIGDNENAVRVLNVAGAPERSKAEFTVGGDLAAMATLASALDALGRKDEAREAAGAVADQMRNFIRTGADQGVWANTLLSCSLAVLGDDNAAMEALSKVNDGLGLPRLPWLKDFPCFTRFHGDARYERVIAAVEKRQAALRAQVDKAQ